MKRALSLILCSACIFGTGASVATAGEIPPASAFNSEAQKKVMSVQHWKSVASDLASQFHQRVPAASVSIDNFGDESNFGKLFRGFVEEELIALGYSITDQGGTKLSYTTSVMRHNSESMNTHRFGQSTAIGAGLLVVREVAMKSAEAGIMAGALLSDIVSSTSATPTRTELVISSRGTTAEGRMIFAKSDVYYIERSDANMYGNTAPVQLKEIKVR